MEQEVKSKSTTAAVDEQHIKTIAEDQLEHQTEALKLKRLEKFYFKSFARDTQFAMFSFGGHTLAGHSFFGERKKPLSLYGHRKPDKVETL